jgi:glutamyl-tRNA reductase
VSVVVIGLNHRTVPLAVLERMTFSPSRLPKALDDVAGREHVGEAVILSTCERTEVYVVAERFHGVLQSVRNFLAEQSFTAPEDFGDHLYAYYEDNAVAHLFKVASGLDSAVLGEGEILGQVRAAADAARVSGSAGAVLLGLFRQAVEVGKRARSDTAIARGVTSVSQAAVAMATARLGTLDGSRVLVVGAGETGEGIVVALGGRSEVLVANRTLRKAAEVAHRVGGTPLELSAVPAALTSVDVLLTSTSAPGTVLDAEDLVAVMGERDGRPLLVVDVALPRDVEPAAADIDGVTLLDMDDIRAFAEAGRADRLREVDRVMTIVDDEVARYGATVAERQVAPLVAGLRERAEGLRVAELQRFRARLDGLDPKQREAVDAVTRGILAKLLHEPTVRLKEEAGTPRGERLADAVRTLFDL